MTIALACTSTGPLISSVPDSQLVVIIRAACCQCHAAGNRLLAVSKRNAAGRWSLAAFRVNAATACHTGSVQDHEHC